MTELDKKVFHYLTELEKNISKRCVLNGSDHFLDINNIEEALCVNMSSKLNSILIKIAKSEAAKVSKKDLTNIHEGIDIVDVADSHINYATFVIFRNRIENDDIKCVNAKRNITNLCKLFGLNLLHNNSTGCYETGYFQSCTSNFSDLILDAIKKVNLMIRPQAVSIIESVGMHD